MKKLLYQIEYWINRVLLGLKKLVLGSHRRAYYWLEYLFTRMTLFFRKNVFRLLRNVYYFFEYLGIQAVIFFYRHPKIRKPYYFFRYVYLRYFLGRSLEEIEKTSVAPDSPALPPNYNR